MVPTPDHLTARHHASRKELATRAVVLGAMKTDLRNARSGQGTETLRELETRVADAEQRFIEAKATADADHFFAMTQGPRLDNLAARIAVMKAEHQAAPTVDTSRQLAANEAALRILGTVRDERQAAATAADQALPAEVLAAIHAPPTEADQIGWLLTQDGRTIPAIQRDGEIVSPASRSTMSLIDLPWFYRHGTRTKLGRLVLNPGVVIVDQIARTDHGGYEITRHCSRGSIEARV